MEDKMKESEIERIRLERKEAQNDLAIMIKRLKIHQKVYDMIKRDYTRVLRRYQRLDLAYAMKTKVTICPAKTAKKARKTRNVRNVMPSKVQALLSDLPEEARKRIIAAYK